jgi:NitT/TauT family transport system permease protein
MAAGGIDEGHRTERYGGMTRTGLLRLLVIVGLIGLIEILCRVGVIDNFTMPPPSRIALDLWRIIVTGKFNAAIAKTLSNAATAFVFAVSIGIASGVIIHAVRPLRHALDPFFATYYAIPVLAFYPLLIILFGLGDAPKIIIAFMLGVVAVIVNTLNGLDRVPRVLLKTARMARLGHFATAIKITLPSATPYVLTGVKFAVAYALIGIIGSEFVMSTNGIGFEIAFAYNNFDNATMYPLILLVMIVSVSINMMLVWWEKRLLSRRGLR